ncbi:hypothetical protein E1176_04370, partial [Fulvivirga sp. RKSG066]|nr:hypothetical protein [Fulvivirga aurantia]
MSEKLSICCLFIAEDNTSDDASLGWVDLLEKYLVYVANKRHNTSLSLQKLAIQEHVISTEAISNEIVLVVVSEAAQNNTYWQQTVDLLLKTDNDRLVISLVKEPLTSNNLPQRLRSHKIFDFYLLDSGSGEVVPVERLLSTQYLNTYLFRV